jgi:hypothetical protein
MQRVHVCPAAEFFLNFPTVSLFQWHPFSVRHVDHPTASCWTAPLHSVHPVKLRSSTSAAAGLPSAVLHGYIVSTLSSCAVAEALQHACSQRQLAASVCRLQHKGCHAEVSKPSGCAVLCQRQQMLMIVACRSRATLATRLHST